MSRDRPMAASTIHQWVNGLTGGKPAIVSLLGRKGGTNGVSEFAFYPFSGGLDTPAERGKKPTFQEWLDLTHSDRGFIVHEHPTFDYAGVAAGTSAEVISDIRKLLDLGHTVFLVDSGGDTRTGWVCRAMGATEDSRRYALDWRTSKFFPATLAG